MKPFVCLLFAAVGAVPLCATAEPALRVQATPSLASFARDLVRPAREAGIELKLMEEAGNNQVINALNNGEIDVALITRAPKVEERVSNPGLQFHETTLGTYVITVAVAAPVWESGVHALTREQILGLYEGKTRRWKEVGGEDRPAVFFEPAHERGPWEIFAGWLYGELAKAPAVPWQVVSDGPDSQSALQFASGGISVMSLRWADKRNAFPLALVDERGKAIEPTKANILDGTYPLTRPVIVVFPREPAAEKKKLLEFLVGEKGQKIVGDHDFVPQSTLRAP